MINSVQIVVRGEAGLDMASYGFKDPCGSCVGGATLTHLPVAGRLNYLKIGTEADRLTLNHNDSFACRIVRCCCDIGAIATTQSLDQRHLVFQALPF
jgi:hypothetical protein